MKSTLPVQIPGFQAGIVLAILSGICNGLFTTPMKMQPRWKWENLWLVFIVVACPVIIVTSSVPGWTRLLAGSPSGALTAALLFGFAWGFGAISFGQSVDSLGVSVANSLVIGLSSALGSLVPLMLGGNLNAGAKLLMLFAGIVAFLLGVALCGQAGIRRDRQAAAAQTQKPAIRGYLFAIAAGILSRFSKSVSPLPVLLRLPESPWVLPILGPPTASGC